nr:calcyclin-associated protein, CAP50=Ca2+/phospholipid-binding protein L-7 fragment [rabbits, lung, Peptide Partial, 9 aa] [Oryctolagus cuniculus]
SELSGNFEK